MSSGVPTQRTQILHNIDDIYGISALMDGDWKIIKGNEHLDKKANIIYRPNLLSIILNQMS